MNRSATIARKRILVVWTVAVMSAASLAATAHAAAITYDVEFTDYAGGPELQWLDKKGYEPERDADNSKKVVVSHTKSGLVLETRKQAAGLLLSKVQIHTYSTIRITWGVNAFPPGASYAKGVRSEAIMVYVFFGTEKIESGHFLVPDSPYFIGLYLCDWIQSVGVSRVDISRLAVATSASIGRLQERKSSRTMPLRTPSSSSLARTNRRPSVA